MYELHFAMMFKPYWHSIVEIKLLADAQLVVNGSFKTYVIAAILSDNCNW